MSHAVGKKRDTDNGDCHHRSTEKAWKKRKQVSCGEKGYLFSMADKCPNKHFSTEQEILVNPGESRGKKPPNKQHIKSVSDSTLASVGLVLPTGAFCSYALSILTHALLP